LWFKFKEKSVSDYRVKYRIMPIGKSGYYWTERTNILKSTDGNEARNKLLELVKAVKQGELDSPNKWHIEIQILEFVRIVVVEQTKVIKLPPQFSSERKI